MRNLIKNELDYQSGMVEARREGLAEGLNKASLDIAYKVKNAGRPLSEIMEFTGLPMETITQL
jgi:predicted transposase YdaD